MAKPVNYGSPSSDYSSHAGHDGDDYVYDPKHDVDAEENDDEEVFGRTRPEAVAPNVS